MEPRTRRQFRDYILRRLGSPVTQINVDIEQVEDRIDDALAYYYDYHYLGSEGTFYTHTLTNEDLENGFINIPEHILAIHSILPLGNRRGGSTRETLFDIDRYVRIEAFSNIVSGSFVPYYLAMTRMSDMSYLMDADPTISFNRHSNQVRIDSGWLKRAVSGQKLVFNVNVALDKNQYSDIWKDRWLKQYATALVKKQWGENIKVFGAIPVMGGVTIDGKTIFDEAVEEIRLLEEKMINSYSAPPLDCIA